ncbi:MAG: hypothetical protein JW715_16790 [Sedimentisphaerales bacterium]|nr:hypothetical protein [Sedimentisphaerales bacterium]
MGEETLFDLNDAIAKWRRKLRENGGIRRADMDELENHLRDEMEHLARNGKITEQDFDAASAQLGDINVLSEEFSKVNNDSGLIGIINNEVISMNSDGNYRSDRFIMMLLFIGFCGIIGWLGTTGWMLHGWTNSHHWATFGNALQTIGRFSFSCSFFLLFALFGMSWGLKLLKRVRNKMRFVLKSLIPAFILSPIYIFIGMAIILTTSWWGGWARAAFIGHRIVQSQVSPDGKFEAYVADMPSIDPPNHYLYIREKQGNISKEIARLAEDVDSIQKIHWSQYSDIVVFESWFNLIAVRVNDYRMIKIPLGGEKHWRKNHTFWVDYNDVTHPEAIEFPEPGVFSYRLEGAVETKNIDMESLESDG